MISSCLHHARTDRPLLRQLRTVFQLCACHPLTSKYDSNGTFRNVPLLLSHACPCAVRFDAYIVEKTKHWNLDLSHYAPASRPEPPEPLVCSDYERCQHCNYMAHGFQCEHGNGKCVLTDMEELNGRW